MPIIRSLLDVDFYKFTMGQVVFKKYADVPVRYALKCRTKGARLATYIDEVELRAELDRARTLRFNKTELHYLRGTNEYSDRMFVEPYLEFLGGLTLPPYELERMSDDFRLEFAGPWATTIYWETIALSIINELYNRAQIKRLSRFENDLVYATGKMRLAEKIRAMRARPNVRFSDFGTRRRFSREWQDYVVRTLAEELPSQLLGTSNTYLAMKRGLVPMGTSAHEMFMVMAGIMHGSDDEIRASHNRVLQDWWEEYGHGLSIALTDTFGTNFFFRDMSEEQAHLWKGLRQDSGDPVAFGEKAIAFYERMGIDPRDKLIIFSDGLDIGAMLAIADRFAGRIKVAFGWGTNLTNDLGINPLSLVVKVVEANGHGTVKLSDNIAKATGRSEDIERFKRIFGYSETTNEECRY